MQVTEGSEVGARKAGDIHRPRTATARGLLLEARMDEPHSLRSRGGTQADGPERLLRSVLFPIRLTPSEREQLGELARERGLAIASYLRALALGPSLPPRRPEPRPVPAINREAYWQLGQVGNNLNQIARRIHIAEGDEPTAAEILRTVGAVGELLHVVRLQLVGAPAPEGQGEGR